MGLLIRKEFNCIFLQLKVIYDLRASERRNIYFNNFEIGDNYIRFEENVSKMFPRVLLDLKYESRVVKLACHEKGMGVFYLI